LTFTAESSVLTLAVDSGSVVGAEVTLGASNFFLAHSWAVSSLCASFLHFGTLFAVVTSIARGESLCTLPAEETGRATPALFFVSGASLVSVGTSFARNGIISHTSTRAVVSSWA